MCSTNIVRVTKYWPVRVFFFGLSTTSNPTTIRINDLKKKTKCWDRTSVDGRGSTARILFREDNSDGENV